MFSLRKLNLTLVAILLLMYPIKFAMAGNTGKLSGTVTDASDHQPIPGAVVIIEELKTGANTDADGKYVILNLPPQTYTVKVRLVGYRTRILKDVKISADQTCFLDAELEDTMFQDSTQVVIVDRDYLKLPESHRTDVLDNSELDVMPVDDVNQLIATQPGVIVDQGAIHIWGSRPGEAMTMVDAIDTRDPLGGAGAVQPGFNLSTSSIQEVQISKNASDAESGNSIGGSIKVYTKEGSFQKTSARISYWTDNFRHPALNKYSFNYDRVSFSLGGPEVLLSQKILPALGINSLDGNVAYIMNFEMGKSDGAYRFNDYAPEYHQKEYRTRNILGLQLRDRQNNNYQFQTKVTYRPIGGIKLTLNYLGRWDSYNPFSDWSYRYTPGTSQLVTQNSQLMSLTLNHQLNQSTFYELILSRYVTEYSSAPDNPANPGHLLTPDDFLLFSEWEEYADVNGNGRYDLPEPFINVNGDTTYLGLPDHTNGDVIGIGGIKIDADEYADLINVPWDQAQQAYDTLYYDWDHDGYIDNADAEPYIDLNGNGQWDAGDYLTYDTNGNGIYDLDRAQMQDVDRPEPYVDGDRSLGEPFTDVNSNGKYEEGIDIFVMSSDPAINMDLNRNSRYDGPDDPWTVGIPYEDLNGNGLYDHGNGRYDYGEQFVDLNHNGKWDQQDGFYDYGFSRSAGYHKRQAIINSLDFKIIKQIITELENKTGFQIKYNELHMEDLQYPQFSYDGRADNGPYQGRGVFRDFYDQYPYQAAMFTTFKLEFGSLIANLGWRLDMFFQSKNVGDLVIEDFARQETVGSRFKNGPRFGISFPFTDRAKIYLNYGHYYQLPEYEKMYRQATQSSSAFGIVGNTNLDYKKSISYEFGLTYALSHEYILDIAGFYKDMFSLVNSRETNYGPYSRHEYENTDYARARGFELDLRKVYGNYITGSVGYAYSFAYGKSSSANSEYYDDFYNRAIPIRESPLEWDVRHQLSMQLGLNVPVDARPRLFGMRIPSNWGLTAIWQLASGKPFTPSRDYPGMKLLPGQDPLVNSMRMPATSNVDLRFHKNFGFAGVDYIFEVWVLNLFDNHNAVAVYSNTGRADTGTNIGGEVMEGTDYANNPLLYESGRNIRVGLSMRL